jgi:hypothetical protein
MQSYTIECCKINLHNYLNNFFLKIPAINKIVNAINSDINVDGPATAVTVYGNMINTPNGMLMIHA